MQTGVSQSGRRQSDFLACGHMPPLEFKLSQEASRNARFEVVGVCSCLFVLFFRWPFGRGGGRGQPPRNEVQHKNNKTQLNTSFPKGEGVGGGYSSPRRNAKHNTKQSKTKPHIKQNETRQNQTNLATLPQTNFGDPTNHEELSGSG